ncbi:MAG: insulinase family protein [Provencibacterium sp.]|jgi:predicted Zn-dependent peptidase|nr:insulinase family protein [Provencibacterium sp.]
MQNCFYREQLADGIYFSHVADSKFYSNRLSVNLVVPLAAGSVTDNAIVPSVLRLGCRTCPDFTALNRRLGLLYGAALGGDVSRFGAHQILSVSAKGLDRRVALQGEDMVRELCGLVCDIALDPLLVDGVFGKEQVDLERHNLIDTILSEINDKRIYAQTQCLSLMFGESPRALHPYGTVEEAQRITPASAYAAYRRMLENAQIELMFVGGGDYRAALETFRARFAGCRRGAVQAAVPSVAALSGPVKERTETMEVNQSKLVMGFRCRQSGERGVYALRLMSAMYGGTPFSKLFLNVREKLSLCYYCSSRYDRGNGVMIVGSGVEKEKKQAAKEEILRQLQAMRDGDFTDEELHNTVLAMNTGFAATGDSLHALESWYLTQILFGQEHSPDEERAVMQTITREEVIEAARGVELDSVYFLTSQGEEASI